MRNTNLFENLSDEQTVDLNGGGPLILAIVGAIITVYGVYETGKNHIYNYNYDKAYKEETERLARSSSTSNSNSSGGSGVMYHQAY